jgi:hypothetical protein
MYLWTWILHEYQHTALWYLSSLNTHMHQPALPPRLIVQWFEGFCWRVLAYLLTTLLVFVSFLPSLCTLSCLTATASVSSKFWEELCIIFTVSTKLRTAQLRAAAERSSRAEHCDCGVSRNFLKSTHLVARWRRHFWLFFAIFSSFFSVAKRGSWCRSSAHKDMRKVSLESEICSTWQEETYHNYNYDICQSSDCYEDFCEWKYKFHRAWHPPAWKTKIDSDAVFQFLYFVKFLFFSNLYFVKFFDINTFSLSRKKREWDREKERERDGFIYCDIFCQVFRHQHSLPLSRLHTIWSQTPVIHESCFCVHCVLTV